jgi:hypothetical protein
MKNENHEGDALRIITDKKGVQLLCTAEGERLTGILKTVITQDTDQAREGISEVTFWINISIDGLVKTNPDFEIKDYALFFKGCKLPINTFMASPSGITGEAMVNCDAYPDPTE